MTSQYARRLALISALSLATVVGCSPPVEPNNDGGTDVVSNPDMGRADVVPGTDVQETDAVTDPDVATPGDGGDGGSGPITVTVPAHTVVAASATGHDRFLAVTFDAAGNYYAVGTIADSTEATADSRTLVARFTPAGTLDTTFGTAGFATHNAVAGAGGEVARGIVVQSTGKIVVAATVEHLGGTDPRDRDIAVMRFNANGTLDTTFGTNGVTTLDLSTGTIDGTTYTADSVWGVAAYADDRIVLTGSQVRAGGTDSDFVVARLTANGARDAAFATNGVFTLDVNNRSASPRTSNILADGSIVTAGYMTDSGVVRPVLFKLTPAGTLDATFGTAGVFAQPVLAAFTEAYAAAVQGDRFVTAGYGRNAASESLDFVSVRFTAAGAVDNTYGTGGFARVDVAGFNDNGRHLVVLPDNRVLMVGGGRPTEMNVDGMLALLTPDGQPDTTFGTNGTRLIDLGGASDFFWGVAVNRAATHVAVVGTRGVGTGGTGNDDAVVLLVSLTR